MKENCSLGRDHYFVCCPGHGTHKAAYFGEHSRVCPDREGGPKSTVPEKYRDMGAKVITEDMPRTPPPDPFGGAVGVLYAGWSPERLTEAILTPVLADVEKQVVALREEAIRRRRSTADPDGTDNAVSAWFSGGTSICDAVLGIIRGEQP